MLAFGSLGDVLPYAALAAGLEATRRFEVRFVTHQKFKAAMCDCGLNVHAIETDPQAMLTTGAGQKLLESGSSPLAFGVRLARILKPVLDEIAISALEECRTADAIICSGLAVFIAPHIAEKLKIPCIPAYLQPVTPTTAFPNAFVSSMGWSATGNRLSHVAYWHGTWALFREAINRVRTRILGLRPLPRGNPFPGQRRQLLPTLYGFSPSVLPKPDDWADTTHVAGYWFGAHDPDWRPSHALVDFLASGPPPVCIGFGSMSGHNPDHATACVLDALRLTKSRGILLTGWGGTCGMSLPDEVLQLDAASHEWLFPKMCAVIHHGGAGTTAAALRAGVPSIVVPFFGDQFFWGTLLHRLGAGAVPIPRSRLRGDVLAAAIQQVTGSGRPRERAAHLGARICSEDGVGLGVAAVQACLEN
jgi:sterol 3beta-glucosyltransferase